MLAAARFDQIPTKTLWSVRQAHGPQITVIATVTAVTAITTVTTVTTVAAVTTVTSDLSGQGPP